MTAPTPPAVADDAEPEHTGGMIALVPANPDELVVDGGDPAEELHLTLAYLGEDVTGMDDATREQLLADVAALAAATPPVDAEVMGHAAFNPTGAHDREPCAVYLVTADGLPALKAEVAPHDLSEHPVFLPHVTAGYGLAPDQLTFVGPLTFDRIRVALADDVHDFPLGKTQEEPVPDTIAAAGGTAIVDSGVEVTGPAVGGEIPIRLPVVVIEGLDTSDGRYLAAGSLQPRALPLPLLAQPESAHGGDDAGAAGVVGRIDTLERIPGPEVVSKRTGLPFPEGTFVWVGTGAISETAKVGDYDIADLFRKRYLRGISVDLAGMDFEVLGDDGSPFDPDNPRRQVVTHSAELAAATLVPIPAFGDCYAEEATETATLDPIAPDDLPEGLAAAAAPAWRSSELGEMCGLCAAGLAEPVDPMDGPMMVARIPANAADAIAQVIDTGEQRDAYELAAAIVAMIADNWSADVDEDPDDELAPGYEKPVVAAAEPGSDEPPAVDTHPFELDPDTGMCVCGAAEDDPVHLATEEEPAAMADDVEGDPAAPQTCELGDEPAVRSLIFRDGEAYVAVCDAHEQDARDTLEASGETVSDVVEIAPDTSQDDPSTGGEMPDMLCTCPEPFTNQSTARTADASSTGAARGPADSAAPASTNGAGTTSHSPTSTAPTATSSSHPAAGTATPSAAMTASAGATPSCAMHGAVSGTGASRRTGAGTSTPAAPPATRRSAVAATTPSSGASGSSVPSSNGSTSTPSSSSRTASAGSAAPPSSSALAPGRGTTRTSTMTTTRSRFAAGSARRATAGSAHSATTPNSSGGRSPGSSNGVPVSNSPTSFSRTDGLAAALADGHPSIQWFRNPNLQGLTPLTVEPSGRVYGHIAGWGTAHTGFQGRSVQPPRSNADYAYFHSGAVRVVDGNEVVEISAGHLTMNTGHAATHLGHRDTAAHYDHTGSIVANVCAGEDAYGIWFSGALVEGLDELSVRRFRSCGLSGDWRRIGGGLELVAALSVPVPGFPIPRARVASGAPQALVAAGAVVPDPDFLRTGSVEDFADMVAARLDERRRAGELSAQQEALLASLDETPQRAATLLAELDETPARFAAALAGFEAGDAGPKGLVS